MDHKLIHQLCFLTAHNYDVNKSHGSRGSAINDERLNLLELRLFIVLSNSSDSGYLRHSMLCRSATKKMTGVFYRSVVPSVTPKAHNDPTRGSGWRHMFGREILDAVNTGLGAWTGG